METLSKNKEDLVITRVFNGPREQVWDAWTDPQIFRTWWGPKGFTSPYCKIDLQVGGTYLNCMRSPDGKDFWSTGRYLEIVPMKKIVCTDSFADADGNVVPATRYGMSPDFPLEMRVTVTFEDDKDGTRMTLRHTGIPVGEMREQTRAGWNESFDKLAKALAKPKVMRAA
ncbi:MAG TPA: SRPBCC domain-containing protein [Nitrospirota bacterium]